jgi:hypothetical protein
MAKKRPPQVDDREEVDIIIESEQWESPTSPRFTWRHGLILALILGLAILFAFGFLIIAGIILLAAIVVNVFLWIIRKLA